MTRDQALRKVLACLRLAKSANPNEAAAAMRQARGLMDRYGLTESDALASEIRCKGAPTGCRGGEPAQSIIRLACLVADCYRCSPLLNVMPGRTSIEFFGGGSDPVVAAYAFTVLHRQLKVAKARHIARIRKRANRFKRGEEFAYGWIWAVRQLLPKVEISPDKAKAIELAKTTAAGGQTRVAEGKSPALARSNPRDVELGMAAGRRAALHHGVGQSQARLEAPDQ